MKNLILSIILVLLNSFCSKAQETTHAEINFIAGKYSPSLKIYIDNNLITTFQYNETLKYKIYSKGRFTVTIIENNHRYQGVIEIKANKKYYFIGGFDTANKEISEEDYFKLKKKREKKFKEALNIVTIEEDINQPIGKLDISYVRKAKQGTGFLINKEGYVITNFHVIDGADKITAKGIKGDYNTALSVNVIAIDRQLDLALLKINTKLITFETPPYSIGNSKTNKQASDIFTLGYPMKNTMGEEIKVTTGVINATSGYKGSISEFQISAGIQPGNSGGPLLNKDGEVIGIVNAKIKSTEVENVGYAIKSDYLVFFLEQAGDIRFHKEDNQLKESELSTQVEKASNFIYIIESK